MNRWLSPFERRLRSNARRRRAIILLTGYALCWLADRPIARSLPTDGRPDHRDWMQAADTVGSLYLWIALALALHAHDRRDARGDFWAENRRALLSIGAPALAGLLAELAKVLAGRERPRNTGGEYAFRPWADRLSDHLPSLGMPSSHTAVAFGGAVAIILIFPRTWPVAVAAGLACVASRVASNAHFLTDAYTGALLGYAAAITIDRLLPPRRPACRT